MDYEVPITVDGRTTNIRFEDPSPVRRMMWLARNPKPPGERNTVDEETLEWLVNATVDISELDEEALGMLDLPNLVRLATATAQLLGGKEPNPPAVSDIRQDSNSDEYRYEPSNNGPSLDVDEDGLVDLDEWR